MGGGGDEEGEKKPNQTEGVVRIDVVAGVRACANNTVKNRPNVTPDR